MKLFNNSKREFLLMGVLIGVLLTIAAHELPKLVAQMNLDKALEGMMKARKALQTLQGDTPTLISEQMQILAQYTSMVEEGLADLEEVVAKSTNEMYKSEIESGKSIHAASVSAKAHHNDENAKIAKVSRLVTSSWRLVSASQSRLKHLVAEANNQL